MPRPKLKFSDEERSKVKYRAAMGVPQEKIAQMMGHTAKSLRKHFRQELDIGAAEANCQVAQSLFKNAVAGDVPSEIFWLKTRAGWQERPAFEPASVPPPPFIVTKETGGQQR